VAEHPATRQADRKQWRNPLAPRREWEEGMTIEHILGIFAAVYIGWHIGEPIGHLMLRVRAWRIERASRRKQM